MNGSSRRAESLPARNPASRTAARPKRPYAPAVLLEYGSIAKLTHGASGAFAETGGHKLHACL
jgi:hypothetical protein